VTATFEVWDRANATKLEDILAEDTNGLLQHLEELPSTGKKLNEPGSGSIVVQWDHPAADVLGHGNCLRVYSDEQLVHTFTLSKRLLVETAESDVKQLTVSGEGLLARWREAIVRGWIDGRPVSQERVWNFASPPLDVTAWTDVYNQSWPNSQWGPDKPPEGWPFSITFGTWIWSRAEVDVQPAGSSLFRNEFEVDEASYLVIYAGANSTFDLWLDGVLLNSRDAVKQPDTAGYQKTWHYCVRVSAGSHVVALRGENWPGSISDNPAGVICSAAIVGSDWRISEVLFGSSDDSYNWICVDYPDPDDLPGFTAVEIIQMLLDEAQARTGGLLDGWTVEGHGSFPNIPEFSCRLGDTYLQVLEALAATHIDVAADDEGLVLHVWPKTVGQGETTAVELVEGTHIDYLSRELDDEFYNHVAIIWGEGLTLRTDDDAVTVAGERREKSLAAGQVVTVKAARDIADEFLAAWAYPVEAIVAKIEPVAGSVAGVDFKVGDLLQLAGDEVRCVGIRWDLEESGRLKPLPEFESVSARRQREHQFAVDNMVAKFESPATAPLLDRDLKTIRNGQIQTWQDRYSWSGDIEETLDPDDPEADWQPLRFDSDRRIYAIEVEISGDILDAFGDTTIELARNGTLINGLFNVTLDTSNTRAFSYVFFEYVTPEDKLTVRCIAAGGHIDGTVTIKTAEPI